MYLQVAGDFAVEFRWRDLLSKSVEVWIVNIENQNCGGKSRCRCPNRNAPLGETHYGHGARHHRSDDGIDHENLASVVAIYQRSRKKTPEERNHVDGHIKGTKQSRSSDDGGEIPWNSNQQDSLGSSGNGIRGKKEVKGPGIFHWLNRIGYLSGTVLPERRKFTQDMKEFTPAQSSAYATLAQHCSYRERSAAEVLQKMERMGIIEAERPALLDKLQQDGFQSESRFARAFSRDKVNLEEWGRIKIRQHLQQRGVEESQIQDAFTFIDEELYHANLSRILKRHAAGLRGKSAFELRGRLLRFASGRGYETDLIWNHIRELGLGDQQDQDEESGSDAASN